MRKIWTLLLVAYAASSCVSGPAPICAESGHPIESLADVRAMGWHISEPLSVQSIENDAMDERRSYAQKPNSRKDVPMVPFGFANDRWVDFKAQIVDGDEIRRITTPSACWGQLAGWDGFVIVRHDRIVDFFMTLIS
jgi:hypothetical protein